MPFDLGGFALATAVTAGLPETKRTEEIRLLGGLLGGNLVGVLLLSAAARETTAAEEAKPVTPVAGAPAPGGAVAVAPAAPAPAAPGAVPPAAPIAPIPLVALVQIPDVVDSEGDRAAAQLESLGLVVVLESVESRDAGIGRVIVVEPAAFTVVSRGSEVRLLVCSGVMVPDVTGMRADDAEEALCIAGFIAERRNLEKAGKHGVVECQDPAAGTMTNRDSTVTIEVGTAKRRGQLQSAPSSREE
jgi:hypothetical protein